VTWEGNGNPHKTSGGLFTQPNAAIQVLMAATQKAIGLPGAVPEAGSNIRCVQDRRSNMTDPSDRVSVRYMVDDVEESVVFYAKFLGFEVLNKFLAFGDVSRGKLRLLLSGPASSAGRPMPDGAKPRPGGWNRINLIVDDLPGEVARLRSAGVRFRNDVVRGPGGSQILLNDPSGNLVELFQPAHR
jgi:catechol 2,3-dioxygenase-like lactoylglutathione lyase family enzyme